MRGAAALALAISASLLVLGPASAQQATTGPAPSLVPASAPARAPAPALTAPRQRGAATAKAGAKCDNPNALGVTRTVEIDTTGGPGFGFEHFRQLDFL